MTFKKVLSGILMIAAFTAPLLSEGREKPSQEELEMREKVIQDMVAENSGRGLYANKYSYYTIPKVVYRGRRDEQGRIQLQRSNESQLAQAVNWKNLPAKERYSFMNARNMAIAGVSAGGILYFFPSQKIFFWETNDQALHEGRPHENILTNPVIGGILSDLLEKAQKELKQSRNKFLGSSRLGQLLMMILNPADGFVQNINEAYGNRVFTSGTTEITTDSPMKSPSRVDENDRPSDYIGLQFQIRF